MFSHIFSPKDSDLLDHSQLVIFGTKHHRSRGNIYAIVIMIHTDRIYHVRKL